MFKRYSLINILTKNFNILSKADANADADSGVTAIALPVLSYRRAKNTNCWFSHNVAQIMSNKCRCGNNLPRIKMNYVKLFPDRYLLSLLLFIDFICVGCTQSHVIPPTSSGRLQEKSRKIGKNSPKITTFLTKIQNLPEMNQEFSYIFF